jgi:hypothetical protein
MKYHYHSITRKCRECQEAGLIEEVKELCYGTKIAKFRCLSCGREAWTKMTREEVMKYEANQRKLLLRQQKSRGRADLSRGTHRGPETEGYGTRGREQEVAFPAFTAAERVAKGEGVRYEHVRNKEESVSEYYDLRNNITDLRAHIDGMVSRLAIRVAAIESERAIELDKVTWQGGEAFHRGQAIGNVVRSPMTRREIYYAVIYRCHQLGGHKISASFTDLHEGHDWIAQFGRLA